MLVCLLSIRFDPIIGNTQTKFFNIQIILAEVYFRRVIIRVAYDGLHNLAPAALKGIITITAPKTLF
jgi:hypothetical protein